MGLSYKEIGKFKYQIPKTSEPGMLVDGIIFADSTLMEQAAGEDVLKQVVNVAKLKGIYKASMAMPDIHLGYGFAVGGVAAFDAKDGIISPGGVGFDINCGVRLLRTDLSVGDIKPVLKELMHELSRSIPKGVGAKGVIALGRGELAEAVSLGVPWAIDKGHGSDEDAEVCEEGGRMESADCECVSDRAYERGSRQLGTLGAGNHFIEIQRVDEVFDDETAATFGLFEGQAVIMIHSGSRGFGHQVCTDYLREMQQVSKKYDLQIPDRQLASAPADSPEAKRYYGAMSCAMNYAWINRQIMGHLTRKSFEYIFKKKAEDLGMRLVYDVAHNSAKLEKHRINGKGDIEVYVHRKGATRAFGPGQSLIPNKYEKTGQPVFVPGDMGRSSFVLTGTEVAMRETFGSTCHGAGRLLSRTRAKKIIRGDELKRKLEAQGIVVIAGHIPSLAEEAPEAYKDVSKVVEICHTLRISSKVAKLKPLGVMKG